MPVNSQYVVDVPLEFCLAVDFELPECRSHDIVDICLDRAGTFLAVALVTQIIIYEASLTTWTLKGTYRFQNPNLRVTTLVWTHQDILAASFNIGEIVLIRISSSETISRGFQVSYQPIKSMVIHQNMRYMAISAGAHEVGIWESCNDDSEWRSILYIPLPPSLEESKHVNVASIQWDMGRDEPVIVVVYTQGIIVSWSLDFATDQVNIRSISTERSPINAGVVSPNGQHFVFPDPHQSNSYAVCNLQPGNTIGPFQCDEAIKPPFSAKFMFGGDWFLAAGVGKLYLWHVTTPDQVVALTLGDVDVQRRITFLSVCGQQSSKELSNVKVAGLLAASDESNDIPRLIVWKFFPAGQPPDTPIPLRHLYPITSSTQRHHKFFLASSVFIMILVSVALGYHSRC